MFVQWINNNRSIIEAKYLSIFGISIAFICLIQYILTFYDVGTEYSVKKYGFSLLTILLIQLSIIFSLMIRNFNCHKAVSSILESGVTGKIIIYTFGMIILLTVVPNKKYHDVSQIVEMEKRISNLTYNEIPQAPAGKSNVVIGISEFSHVMNYLFSISFAKTQRDIAIADLLIAEELSDTNKYHKIISSQDNPIYGSNGICASSVPGNISIIDSLCLEPPNQVL